MVATSLQPSLPAISFFASKKSDALNLFSPKVGRRCGVRRIRRGIWPLVQKKEIYFHFI